MMSFYGTPLDDLDAAIAADPAWLLPRLMKAGFLLSLTEPWLVGEAAARSTRPQRAADRGDERERDHLAALRRLAAGDWVGAAAAWEEVLRGHPRDALALQWAHLFDFYRGDARSCAGMSRRCCRRGPTTTRSIPTCSRCTRSASRNRGATQAEATGRRALAGAARVPWAIHAVAHVMEMQGRHEEGTRWMGEWRRHWGAREGDGSGDEPTASPATSAGTRRCSRSKASTPPTALRVFDDLPRREPDRDHARSASTPQRCSGACACSAPTSAIAGTALVAGWPLDAAAAGHSVFNDAHATMALIGAGELARARGWLALCSDRRERRARLEPRDLARRRRAADARLARVRRRRATPTPSRRSRRCATRLARIGGSHAQRDIVEQTLLAAAAHGGDRAAGPRRCSRRERAPRPTTPLSGGGCARSR